MTVLVTNSARENLALTLGGRQLCDHPQKNRVTETTGIVPPNRCSPRAGASFTLSAFPSASGESARLIETHSTTWKIGLAAIIGLIPGQKSTQEEALERRQL